MNYNNRRKQNSGNLRNIVGFSLFGSVLFLAFGVIPNVFQEELVEGDAKHKIAKFVAAQPNYLDSLLVFDRKYGKEMAELDKIANNPAGGDVSAKKILDSKIADRNQLVIKKEEIYQLVQNYTDSVQRASGINLGIKCSQNGMNKSR